MSLLLLYRPSSGVVAPTGPGGSTGSLSGGDGGDRVVDFNNDDYQRAVEAVKKRAAKERSHIDELIALSKEKPKQISPVVVEKDPFEGLPDAEIPQIDPRLTRAPLSRKVIPVDFSVKLKELELKRAQLDTHVAEARRIEEQQAALDRRQEELLAAAQDMRDRAMEVRRQKDVHTTKTLMPLLELIEAIENGEFDDDEFDD